MKITRTQPIGAQEMLDRFATTRLRGYGQPLIYERARLELVRQVDPKTLFPAQRYVLKEDHHAVLELHEAFRKQGIDAFNMEGGMLFWKAGEEGPIPFMPPIVEMSREPDGRTLPLINDGMHRIFTAMKLNRPVTIILAHGVPTEYPYYAYALAKGWDEVVELDALPDRFVKKTYRDPQNYKSLFRDFNAVFDGIQKQRKKTSGNDIQ
ncbi:MAG TPA: hypothetical protein DCS88_09245 [Alphaproteobacteria bacterium]|nr:hypothetical protein [Alphaproteobacteria bacterium]